MAKPYVKELRERTRRIMESPDGIQKLATDYTNFAHLPANKGERAMKIKEIVGGEPVSRILSNIRASFRAS